MRGTKSIIKKNYKLKAVILKYSESLSIANFAPYIVFFFTPTFPLLISVGILVLCDVITGICASRKRGEKIQSRKMERTVAKLVLFSIGILISRLMEVVFFPYIPITSIVAGYIALTEFKSNMENISEATGIDIWTFVLNKLQGLKESPMKKHESENNTTNQTTNKNLPL